MLIRHKKIVLPKPTRDTPSPNVSIEVLIPDKNLTEDETGLKQLEEPMADSSPVQTDEVIAEKVADAGHKFSMQTRQILIWVSLAIGCLTILIVLWSRVYLGAHSISQVSLGCLTGLLYGEYYLSYAYKKIMRAFSKCFFLNFSNPYERRYLQIISILAIPIVNISMGLIYLITLRDPPHDRAIYKANMLASMCGEKCNSTATFEWKDYTTALYINFYLAFILAMLLFHKEPYTYDHLYVRHQKWKHIILRNMLVVVCMMVSFLPILLLKPLNLKADLFTVVAKLMATFLMCGLIVYVVPSLYKWCKIEARGGFI